MKSSQIIFALGCGRPISHAPVLIRQSVGVQRLEGWGRKGENNMDGFMRHGRPNDSDLPLNYRAVQGQREELFQSTFLKAL